MTLIIGTTPHSQWQPLISLLEPLGWQAQAENAEKWYQSPNPAAKHADNTRYLLLHTRPEHALAQAMDDGSDPDTALNEWRRNAEQLLAFYKGHRRQAVMVECISAMEQPQALLEWLAHNHPAFSDLEPSSTEISTSIKCPGQPATNLSLLLATQLVAQTEDLQPLLAQLEASTLPLTEAAYQPPQVDVNAVYRDTHQQAQISEEEMLLLGEKLAEKMREEEELIRQLLRVQEEMEAKHLKHEQATKTKAELRESARELESAIEKLQAELKDARNELDTHRQAAQKALETKENGQSAQAQEHQQARQKAEAACDELKQENDLILKQLFQVQEELEKYFLDVKEKESQNSQLAQAQSQLKADVKQAQAKLAQAQKRLKTAEGKRAKAEQSLAKLAQVEQDGKAELALSRVELRQLQKKIHFMEHSTSWRLTAPLRKVARSLHKPSRLQKLIDHQVKLVKNSEYFDPKWYLQRYPDIAQKEVEPAEHYVMYGGREGRPASKRFASKEYLRRYPDVAEAGLNPLVHYLEHGRAEGRKAPKLT